MFGAASKEFYAEVNDVSRSAVAQRLDRFLWHDPVGRIVPLVADETFDAVKNLLTWVSAMSLHEYFTYEIDTYTDAKSLHKLNYFITTFVIMIAFVVLSRVVQDVIHRKMGPSGMTPIESKRN